MGWLSKLFGKDSATSGGARRRGSDELNVVGNRFDGLPRNALVALGARALRRAQPAFGTDPQVEPVAETFGEAAEHGERELGWLPGGRPQAGMGEALGRLSSSPAHVQLGAQVGLASARFLQVVHEQTPPESYAEKLAGSVESLVQACRITFGFVPKDLVDGILEDLGVLRAAAEQGGWEHGTQVPATLFDAQGAADGSESGADADPSDALIAAAGRDGAARVAELLDSGLNPDVRAASGVAPLHAAAIGGRADSIETLAARGAFVDARTDVGQTPLHGAAVEGRESAVRALLEAGAEVDAREENGATPLHLAAARGHVAAARALLEGGADPEARSSPDRPVRRWAGDAGHSDVVALLDGSVAAAPPPRARRTTLVRAAQRIADEEVERSYDGVLLSTSCNFEIGGEWRLTRAIGEALEASPEDPALLFALSEAYYARADGETGKALRERMLAIAPDHRDARQRSEHFETWLHLFHYPGWSEAMRTLPAVLLQQQAAGRPLHVVLEDLVAAPLLLLPAERAAFPGEITAVSWRPSWVDTPHGPILEHYAMLRLPDGSIQRSEAALAPYPMPEPGPFDGDQLVRRIADAGFLHIVFNDGEDVLFARRHGLPADVRASLEEIRRKVEALEPVPDVGERVQRAAAWHVANSDLEDVPF